MIDRSLTGRAVGADGRPYLISAQTGAGFPSVDLLANELWRQQPVLVSYRSSQFTGHVVVITGAIYYQQKDGSKTLAAVYIRDPYPTQINIQNLGRVEITDVATFAASVQRYWFVRIAPGR